MNHICEKAEIIATLVTKVENIEQDKIDEQAWRERFEGKLDKILWFLLGSSVSITVAIVGWVMNYVITKA